MKPGQPVFFLDRDGVINEDSAYVHKSSEFHFLPGVFDACRLIRLLGYQIIIITNQAGIGRGYYSEADFAGLTDWMLGEFAAQGVDIKSVYYCPHHPKAGIGDYKVSCDCRKPAPGMLLKAQADHAIDLSASYLVGDKLSDIGAGIRAGLKHSFLVRGRYDEQEPTENPRFDNLLDVVRLNFDVS